MQKMKIGERITQARKQLKWSQADLGHKVGVSREIIGRYERGEVSPSIDVAIKIAEAMDVSLDYLAGGNVAHFDNKTIQLINEIEELAPEVKDKLIFLANAVIRDYKAGKAYLVS
jgi:transcriptional regulator with XRE-family HTH domain